MKVERLEAANLLLRQQQAALQKRLQTVAPDMMLEDDVQSFRQLLEAAYQRHQVLPDYPHEKAGYYQSIQALLITVRDRLQEAPRQLPQLRSVFTAITNLEDESKSISRRHAEFQQFVAKQKRSLLGERIVFALAAVGMALSILVTVGSVVPVYVEFGTFRKMKDCKRNIDKHAEVIAAMRRCW